MEVSFETFRWLEGELPRKLKDSLIERGVDLAKVGVVDVKRIRHREIGVVEDVERFKPQLNTKSFLESDALDDRSVDVPVTRAINRRQAQLAYVTSSWMGKERRIGATITRDQ